MRSGPAWSACYPRARSRGVHRYGPDGSCRNRAYLRRRGIRCTIPDKADQAANRNTGREPRGCRPRPQAGSEGTAPSPPAAPRGGPLPRGRERRAPRSRTSSGTPAGVRTARTPYGPQWPRARWGVLTPGGSSRAGLRPFTAAATQGCTARTTGAAPAPREGSHLLPERFRRRPCPPAGYGPSWRPVGARGGPCSSTTPRRHWPDWRGPPAYGPQEPGHGTSRRPPRSLPAPDGGGTR